MPHECTNCGRTFPDGSKQMLSGCPDCGGNKFQFAPNATAARDSSDRAGSGGSDRDGSRDRPAPDAGVDESNGVASRAAETVRDWVSTDSSDDARSLDAGEFAEWPDTARRPEDRSTANAADRETTAGSSASAVDRSPSVTDDGGSIDRSADRDADSPSVAAESTAFADEEDTAQADARSEVVSRDDLPSDPVDTDGTTAGDAADAPAGGADAPPDHGRVVSEPSTEQPSIEELREELNQQFESIKILSPGQYELNLMELYNREEYIISLQEDGRYVIDVPDSWRGSDEE